MHAPTLQPFGPSAEVTRVLCLMPLASFRGSRLPLRSLAALPRYELIPGDKVAQGLLRRLGDAYPRGRKHAPRAEAVCGQEQVGVRVGEVLPVVPQTGDSKRFRQAPGATGQQPQYPRAVCRPFQTARLFHFLDSGQWLQSPEEHRPRLALRHAGNVQTIVVAINEINVSVARRAKQHL